MRKHTEETEAQCQPNNKTGRLAPTFFLGCPGGVKELRLTAQTYCDKTISDGLFFPFVPLPTPILQSPNSNPSQEGPPSPQASALSPGSFFSIPGERFS